MNLKPSTKISYEEKKQAVRNFIVASYHNQVSIITYHKLTEFLEDERIELLCTLEKTGKKQHYDRFGYYTKTTYHYSDYDAEKYFEWLISVVNETEDMKEDMIKEATNQLFRLLYVMRHNIERKKKCTINSSV